MKYDKRALRRLRLEKGAGTPADVAERAGITAQAAYQLDKGFAEPKAGTLAKLATALGVSVSDFFVDGAA